MTIITTEIQKWKRNKIVWCILALTLLLGAFAIERACSISRSSPFMDSFGDLYTLAFKNLSSLFLPIVLGMFATTLFFDEHKNDTMKELLIIPITKAQLGLYTIPAVFFLKLSCSSFTIHLSYFIAQQQACIQIAATIYTQTCPRTSLCCFLLYQLSLWWVKYRAQPEAINS